MVKKDNSVLEKIIDRRCFIEAAGTLFLGTIMLPSSAFANAKISNARIGTKTNGLRFVFDLPKEVKHKTFLLQSPNRVVVDLQSVDMDKSLESIKDNNGIISKIRIGKLGTNGTRVVFDLVKAAEIKKSFLLKPQSGFNWRLVIDLEKVTDAQFSSLVGGKAENSIEKTEKTEVVKKKVIVLDAGHGGRDPGAIGVSGTKEKNITLAMAKELSSKLNATGKYKVVLTRDRDKSLRLRDRVRLARKAEGDLFISLHADSNRSRKTRGLSVYTLSERASDKEAAQLAANENKADIIAGLDLGEQTREVADILIDLAQRETMNRSAEFASYMVKEMKKNVKLLRNTHRFAGFAVLKAPDIPSVLLEMGYLSNKTEEKLLKTKAYRAKLARSAVESIDNYFSQVQKASLY